MPISFIELSDQIELNQKRLEEQYKRYGQYYSRFSIVSILYSVMAIYLIQLVKFCFSNDNQYKIIFIVMFIVFSTLIIYSIYHSFKLLTPKDVAFQELPKEFYKTIANQYRKEGIDDDELLNEYIKTSYNNQLEEILEINDQLCLDKGKSYFNAFNFACLSIIPYLICISIYLVCPKNESQLIEIKNYKQIIQYDDSVKNISPIQKN